VAWGTNNQIKKQNNKKSTGATKTHQTLCEEDERAMCGSGLGLPHVHGGRLEFMEWRSLEMMPKV
jgi:hypothetical protein